MIMHPGVYSWAGFLECDCNSLATRLQLGSFAVLCFSPRVCRIMHFQDHLSGMCVHDPGKGDGRPKVQYMAAWPSSGFLIQHKLQSAF